MTGVPCGMRGFQIDREDDWLQLVYTRGLNVHNSAFATPIGIGCEVCERIDCPQRAFPPLGRRSWLTKQSLVAPYAASTR